MNTAPTTGAEPAGATIDGPGATPHAQSLRESAAHHAEPPSATAQGPGPQTAANQTAAPQTAAPQAAAQGAATRGAAPQSATAQSTAPQSAAAQSTAPQNAATQSTAPQSAAVQSAAPQGATGDVPNRRERKKLQTRDALEAAAMKLFAARGYDATTVEEIAAEADVAVRTFFRYFGSKQDVLLGDVANDVAGRLRAALHARPAEESPVDAVGAALDALELEGDDQRRQVLDRMWLVERVPELRGAYHVLFQELHDVIAEFVGDRVGEAPQQFRPQLIASAAISAIKTALTVLQSAPDGEPVGELRTRAYATLTAGLR